MGNVTLKDIADRVGVSQNTVSMVFRGRKGVKDTTREQILKAAHELGYVSKPNNMKLGNIGIVVEFGNVDCVYFHSQVLEEFEKSVRERGYQVVVLNIDEETSESLLAQRIADNNIRGVAIIGDVADGVVSLLFKCAVPVIATGFFMKTLPLDCVLEDNVIGSLLMMNHLKQLGYRDIGFIGSIEKMVCLYERYIVFSAYVRHDDTMNGTPVEWIDYSFDQLTDCDFMISLIRNCKKMPEVFFCANDKIAAILLKALSICGYSVPENIGVVGFDNNELAKICNPTLTSIDTFYALQAQSTAREIVRKIEKSECKSTVGRILTRVKLVEGQSVRRVERSTEVKK